MWEPGKITKREQLYLSLSPFTIPELFQTNLFTALSPYLTEDKRRRVPKGFVFYQTEQLASEAFYLKKGMVIEALLNENGLMKDFLIFPHYLVGLNYCAHEQPIFPCTYAYTECEVYPFSYEEILDLMQRDRELLRAVMKTVALDFRLANSSALQSQSCSVHEKICQTILSYFIAGRYNQEVRTMRMTQQLLADLTGVHRVSVAQTVRRLRDEGILGSRGKRMVLLDEERLSSLAYGKYSIQ